MYQVVLFALFGLCAAVPQPADIVVQSSEILPNGTYEFKYQDEDGTNVEQYGSLKKIGDEDAIVARGKYSYKAPDNTEITVTYTADENGFQPTGDHIPAIPAAIAKALEYIAAHPEENEPKKP